jgi:hypothetical protein
MTKLIAWLKKLIEEKRYGKVIIGFQNGKIVSFETRITIDPKEFQDG